MVGDSRDFQTLDMIPVCACCACTSCSLQISSPLLSSGPVYLFLSVPNPHSLIPSLLLQGAFYVLGEHIVEHLNRSRDMLKVMSVEDAMMGLWLLGVDKVR